MTDKSQQDDPIRVFTQAEEAEISRRLAIETERIQRDDSANEQYSIRLLCSWHFNLFTGIKDHAGRMRSADYGEPRLNFGPHRSSDRGEVAALMDEHVRQSLLLGDGMRRVDVDEIIKGALWIHAKLIWIHPFRDGNGRTGRLAMNYWLARNGLPGLSFVTVKDEYIHCLNHFYVERDIDPLFRLGMRMYDNLKRLRE